jgi:hypothetical protein
LATGLGSGLEKVKARQKVLELASAKAKAREKALASGLGWVRAQRR